MVLMKLLVAHTASREMAIPRGARLAKALLESARCHICHAAAETAARFGACRRHLREVSCLRT